MYQSPLSHYLRTYRRRTALSPRELAVLMQLSSERAVLRHEGMMSIPDLTTALRYEVAFGTSIAKIFAGLHEEGEREVLKGAQLLLDQLAEGPGGPITDKKVDYLDGLTGDLSF